MRELIVDSFAGGGGASTGIELATGREYPSSNRPPAAATPCRRPWQRPSCAQTCLSGAGVRFRQWRLFGKQCWHVRHSSACPC